MVRVRVNRVYTNRIATVFASTFCVLLSACADDNPPVVNAACVPQEVAPETIDEAITMINALPEPSLPCLIASLPRPLRVTAVRSQFSAQPAAGVERPRVFVHSDGLVLSVALGGTGAHLLEFGEWTDGGRTIKGEIAFPIDTPLAPSAPFEDLARDGGTGTSCGICHRDEQAIEGRPGAFDSLALRPRDNDVIRLEFLESLVARCDLEADEHQCTLLHALFDYGEVVQENFDPNLGTI